MTAKFSLSNSGNNSALNRYALPYNYGNKKLGVKINS